MSEMHTLLSTAAEPFERLLDSIGSDQLILPTPCAEYDVRALLNHLLYWGPWLAAAARRRPAPEVTGGERDTDLVTGDWRAALRAQTRDLTGAYAAPDAVAGSTRFGGTELPAAMVAAMVLGEFVLHGWDLAAATGRPWHCAPEVAERLFELTAAGAEQAREMKVYGPEVPVPPTASFLERALGVSGRDPAWASPR
ncbi:TIGR03086 family metal-binding protein [Amycolatopsis nigrescens]|uniref:TIGR03086 family metal-binding protein n=1 Tax=Amycolatopsis nigrescens TaxID=381445 RepID=UPI00037BEC13|nr:TIGR03086 family metal-binding protein [Amycolatopsis nigrescens]